MDDYGDERAVRKFIQNLLIINLIAHSDIFKHGTRKVRP